MKASGQKPASSLSASDAVQRAIKNSQYNGADRTRLHESILQAVLCEKSMKEASQLYSIPLGTFHTYYHRARNLLEAAESGLDADSPTLVALINSLGAVTSNGLKRKAAREKEKLMEKLDADAEHDRADAQVRRPRRAVQK